jgi:hypothetical protein
VLVSIASALLYFAFLFIQTVLQREDFESKPHADSPSHAAHSKQRTMMSLCAIARSPLIFGGDLPTSSQSAIDLITNEEMLAVDQKATNSRQLFARENQIAWTSDAAGSRDKYLAVFNVGSTGNQEIKVEWKDLGLAGSVRVRDLWAHKDLGAFQDSNTFSIPPHGSGLYRLAAGK